MSVVIKPMIKLLVVGQGWDPEGSEEFEYGWRTLVGSLPSVEVIRTHSTDLPSLWAKAQDAVATRPYLGPEAQVLLLSHPHLVLAPNCLDLLSATCAQPPVPDTIRHFVVQAHDSQSPETHMAPDYCTLRGMERFTNALGCSSQVTSIGLHRQVQLCNVSTLRADTDLARLPAVLVANAFAHDYANYHSGTREEVIPHIPESTRRILDVGGGAGGFLRQLKSQRPVETHLAELSPQACESARDHVDQVWQGDFLSMPITTQFDCITFLDVLEHTSNPFRWLQQASSLLTDQGCVVASIPNVGHWSVIADLLEGRWDYAPVGIHCITHLRFFTRSTIEKLFLQAGLQIEDIQSVHLDPPAWWQPPDMNHRLAIDHDSLRSYAYILRARPARVMSS